MKDYMGMILGSAVGVAIALFGVYLSGFEWHRGESAVVIYICVLFAAFMGFILGGVASE